MIPIASGLFGIFCLTISSTANPVLIPAALSIIKDNPDGSYQTGVRTSEVISGQTLKASAITVRVLSGEFSNESDRNGNRFTVKSDNTGEAFLATGLNSDKTIKGTASQETISATVPEFLDINIGDFLNYLELGN